MPSFIYISVRDYQRALTSKPDFPLLQKYNTMQQLLSRIHILLKLIFQHDFNIYWIIIDLVIDVNRTGIRSFTSRNVHYMYIKIRVLVISIVLMFSFGKIKILKYIYLWVYSMDVDSIFVNTILLWKVSPILVIFKIYWAILNIFLWLELGVTYTEV